MSPCLIFKDKGRERLLLGIGRQVWTEVDALAVELVAGLTDPEGGLAWAASPLSEAMTSTEITKT